MTEVHSGKCRECGYDALLYRVYLRMKDGTVRTLLLCYGCRDRLKKRLSFYKARQKG